MKGVHVCLFLLAVFVAVGGCTTLHPPSPLSSVWEQEIRDLKPGTMLFKEQATKKLAELYRDLPADVQERERKKLLSQPPAIIELSPFDDYFAERVLSDAVEHDDSQQVWSILTTVPPSWVGYVCMEKYLASVGKGKYFPMIFASFDFARTTYARRTLLETLQRAFPGIAEHTTGEELVSQAAAWFYANRQNVVVNDLYYNIGAAGGNWDAYNKGFRDDPDCILFRFPLKK